MNTNPPSVANIPRVGGPRPPPPGAIASSLLSLPNIFLIVSTIYTVILLVFYATQRHATIPLSHRTYFDDWGGLRALLSASADTNASVTWEELDAVIWCPHGRRSSPQCGCFHDFYHQTYTRGIESVRVGNTTWAQIGTTYADEVVDSCLRARPTWRKDTCGEFCKVHLSTPIILACLYMSLFFSVRSRFAMPVFQLAAAWVPVVLAVCTIVLQLYYDRTGGIVSTLSILSVLIEYFYIGPNVELDQLFYCYQRFACAALAVWVAIAHQARDIYLVTAFAVLGFFAGLVAYVTFLVRRGSPCRHDDSICQYNFLAVFVTLAAFILLIQQSWYTDSPMWSSQVAPCVFLVALVLCLDQTPFGRIGSASLNTSISLILLSLAFAAVLADIA